MQGRLLLLLEARPGKLNILIFSTSVFMGSYRRIPLFAAASPGLQECEDLGLGGVSRTDPCTMCVEREVEVIGKIWTRRPLDSERRT
jgi:hypothetical protein